MNNNCQHFEIALLQSREPGFSPADKAKLDEHLRTCEGCQQRAAEMIEIDSLLVAPGQSMRSNKHHEDKSAVAKRIADRQQARLDKNQMRSKVALAGGSLIAALGLSLDSWIWINGLGVVIYGLGLLAYTHMAGRSLNKLASSGQDLMASVRQELDWRLRCCRGGAILAILLSIPWFAGAFVELPKPLTTLGFRSAGFYSGIIGAALFTLALYFLGTVAPMIARERREFA